MKYINKIKIAFFRGLFSIFLSLFSLPFKKKYRLYGSAFGYADNPRSLFEENVKNKPLVQHVWIAKTKGEYRQVSNLGYYCSLKYSFDWFTKVIAAKVTYISHGINDVSPALPKSTIVVNLWHGTPLKKMGYDAEIDLKSIKLRKLFMLKAVYERWDYLLAANEYSKCCLISATHLDSDKVFISQQPRNKNLKVLSQSFKGDYVIYMPTYRESGNYQHIESILAMWEQVYNETGFKLFLKLHPLDKFKCDDISSVNYILTTSDFDEETTTIDYLAKSYALITDYSSVMFDYIVTEKKFYIYAPDKADYLKDRGGEFYTNFNVLLDSVETFSDASGLCKGLMRRERCSYPALNKYKDIDYDSELFFL